jgi:hypothetical protein
MQKKQVRAVVVICTVNWTWLAGLAVLATAAATCSDPRFSWAQGGWRLHVVVARTSNFTLLYCTLHAPLNKEWEPQSGANERLIGLLHQQTSTSLVFDFTLSSANVLRAELEVALPVTPTSML